MPALGQRMAACLSRDLQIRHGFGYTFLAWPHGLVV